MARALDQLFNVQVWVLERALGFAGRIAKRRVQFGVRIHAAHALAAAPSHCFQQQRIAELPREGAGIGGTAKRRICARHHRSARGNGHLARGGL